VLTARDLLHRYVSVPIGFEREDHLLLSPAAGRLVRRTSVGFGGPLSGRLGRAVGAPHDDLDRRLGGLRLLLGNWTHMRGCQEIRRESLETHALHNMGRYLLSTSDALILLGCRSPPLNPPAVERADMNE
jgi:hypothetical protein